MVLRGTIENLRERPKHEKHAIATTIAISVIGILFIGWVFYVLHSLETAPAPSAQDASPTLDTSSLQRAQSVFTTDEQQAAQAYGSTTQFVQGDNGTIQLEEVSSSSVPSL